jgi:alpha-tubulin suppressor-like RCC1 family protein
VSYTLAVSEAGEVFSFGKGEYGRLGHGDQVDVELSKQIEALRGVYVLTVAAGGAHALALTRSGKVYSWGYGSSGQLGHGLLGTNTTTPAIIEALRGVRVERIAAGEAHSCAASQAGHLLTWGCGISGKLGHGAVYGLVHKSTPTRVEAAGQLRTLGLWAGADHTFVLNGEGTRLAFGRERASGIPRQEDDANWEDGDQQMDPYGGYNQMVPTELDLRLKLP